MEFAKVFHEWRMNYFSYFFYHVEIFCTVTFIIKTICIFAESHPLPPPRTLFTSCNLCRSYNSTNSDFYFYPEGKWLSILFYLEAHFGFKAY